MTAHKDLSDAEKAQIYITTIRDLYNQGTIRTLGDLAAARKIAKPENLPESIRDFSLSPDNRYLLPHNFDTVLAQADQSKLKTALTRAVHAFNKDLRDRTQKATGFPPQSPAP